jgi:neurotransmitter:Na+ symporter, NSS family
MLLAPAFFILLTFAALTSSISLLEVATAYFIDERGWSRTKAALGTGGLIAILGIPSAVAGGSLLFGDGMVNVVGTNWLGFFNDLQGTWMLPIGALGISLFVGWRIPSVVREAGFKAGSSFQWLYPGWVFILRFLIPIGLAAILILNAYELITADAEEPTGDVAEAIEEIDSNDMPIEMRDDQ